MPERSDSGKAPLFIIGSPRSGTTFLTRMVNRFLDIHVARDAGVFLRFHRMLPLYGNLAVTANRRRLIGDLYRDYFFRSRFLERGLNLSEDELCAAAAEPTFQAIADVVLRETARSHGKSSWGNKKPSYSMQGTDLDEVFPTARYVHIIRDGRDVALSMRRATHLLLEQNWYFAARDWEAHVRGGRALGRRVGPQRYLEVSYEELLRQPTRTFEAILQFLGASEHERQALARIDAEIRGVIKAGNLEKWRTQIPGHAIRTIERAAGNLLNDLGYPLLHPGAAGEAFGWAEVSAFQADRLYRRLFTRSLTKTARFKLEQLRTGGRAVYGRLLPSALARSSAAHRR
jgi:hypothetical protein